ncbi:MAG: preprotein translocase subunit SecG [Candidatus Omnitrophota bacterium]
MYITLIVIHCVVCLVLMATILLQAGKGAGLTEAFGGGGDAMQSMLGTQAPILLKRATTVSAIVFLLTSILLGMVTARKGRSLFDEKWAVETSSTQAVTPVAPVKTETALPKEKTLPAAASESSKTVNN